jgi:hypothetical protein
MKYSISEDIISKTNKCTRDLECLNGKKCHCDVVRTVNDQVAIIKFIKTPLCNYHTEFGNTDICSCPVRVELARKYGV